MSSFFGRVTEREWVSRGSARFELPIFYYRDDLFTAFFTADHDRAKALMPSTELHPVTTGLGRAVVAIGAFNYIDTSIGPYGEVAIVIPAVFGHRPPPLLPLLLESKYDGFGHVVLHLPVTNRKARDAGRLEWGYTKFVADMRFELCPERSVCELSEGDDEILKLSVPRTGWIVKDDRPLISYSVKNGELVKTVVEQRAVYRTDLAPKDASLTLGAHPVAESLKTLRLAARPFAVRSYIERAGILPGGVVVANGVRALDGHRGEERDGRHEVIYRSPMGEAGPRDQPRA